MPTVTPTWHMCKYKVYKIHQKYILITSNYINSNSVCGVFVPCIYTHACWVTTDNSGLCCCICITYFQCDLTPLCVDSAWALWASFCFRFVPNNRKRVIYMFGTLHTVQFHSVSCTNCDVIATIPTGHLHVQYTSQTAVSLCFLNKLKCHCCNRKQVIYMFSTLYILQLNSVPWTNPSVAGATSDHGTYMMQTQAPSSFLSL